MNEKLDLHKKMILIKKWVSYTKIITQTYIDLQAHKRQLAKLIKDHNYIQAFRGLDMDKRGKISEKNLQTFLIKHKYFFKPSEINRYFLKYSHGKTTFDYDDMVQSLFPSSNYVLVGSILKETTSICQKAENKMIQNITAFIISEEIEGMKKDFLLMSDITNGSLHLGGILWRQLDRNHCNELTYTQFQALSQEYGCEFTTYEWKGFINWHFGSHKNSLQRDDMMKIFNVNVELKRNRSVCNYNQYVNKEMNKKKCADEVKKQKYNDQLVKERISFVHELSKSRCSVKEVLREDNFPDRVLNKKLILNSKKGYRVPQKNIKYIEINT